MPPARSVLIWTGLGALVAVPLLAAASSPLLAWRDPVYIAAGFAGVMALAFLLLQPLLAAGALPGLAPQTGRELHRWLGTALVLALVVHVGGLWLTSPPDVVDALLFVSPTPFSAWGVIAMWTLLAAALLAALRRRVRLPWRVWRRVHTTLALVTVAGTVVHALLIQGTMEPVSKAVLCLAALAAVLKAMVGLRIWAGRPDKS